MPRKADKRLNEQEIWLRRCKICKKEFPETVEHFFRWKNNTKSGFSWQSSCKDCFRKKDERIRATQEYKLRKKIRGKVWRERNKKRLAPINALKRKVWRQLNPDRAFNNVLYSKYGITLEEYKALTEKQNNRCVICGVHEDEETNKKLCVDHSHTTNRVRGLLCSRCNSALGFFKENITFIEAAIKYKENNQ
jgi:hypothetical protein